MQDSIAGWQNYGHGLLIPEGAMKREKRTSFQATPLEVRKKTKTVSLSKPVLAALNIELVKLQERYLAHAVNYSNVIQFENAAKKLFEEYGLTFVMAVDNYDNIFMDTEELIEEVAGEVSEYQIFSDKTHQVPVKDDLEVFMTSSPGERDWEDIIEK